MSTHTELMTRQNVVFASVIFQFLAKCIFKNPVNQIKCSGAHRVINSYHSLSDIAGYTLDPDQSRLDVFHDSHDVLGESVRKGQGTVFTSSPDSTNNKCLCTYSKDLYIVILQ